jgi:dTDP-4-dehydrorhamnose 3,5-epimerase
MARICCGSLLSWKAKNGAMAMIERLSIPEVFLYTPKRHGDARGFFVETFNRALIEPLTGPLDWVQDNHSRSEPAGVVRGLHFQIGAFAQDKLVRCLRGSILDVAVDIRHGSPTFGQHVSALLSEDNGVQIFVPKGFAHGFATLTPGVEVAYKVTNYYSAAHDRGIRFDDPALGIDWRLPVSAPVLSDKDAKLPLLADAPAYFRFS